MVNRHSGHRFKVSSLLTGVARNFDWEEVQSRKMLWR